MRANSEHLTLALTYRDGCLLLFRKTDATINVRLFRNSQDYGTMFLSEISFPYSVKDGVCLTALAEALDLMGECRVSGEAASTLVCHLSQKFSRW